MKSVFFLFATLAVVNAVADVRTLAGPKARVGVDMDIVPTREQDEQQEVCEVCQIVVGYLKESLSDPSFRQMIIKFVEGACDPLPIPIREVCDYFVDHTVAKYVDEILKRSELEVCQDLKACQVVY